MGSNSIQRRSTFSSTVMRPHGPILACDVALTSCVFSFLYNTRARSQIIYQTVAKTLVICLLWFRFGAKGERRRTYTKTTSNKLGGFFLCLNWKVTPINMDYKERFNSSIGVAMNINLLVQVIQILNSHLIRRSKDNSCLIQNILNYFFFGNHVKYY